MTPSNKSGQRTQERQDTTEIDLEAELAARAAADQAAANDAAAREAKEAEEAEARAQALRDAAVPPPPGSIHVDVNSNLALATGEILEVNQTDRVVADTAEVRALIAAGHLTERDAED